MHVQDIARAFATALAAPREVIHNQAFNVGATAENYQVRELAEIVRGTVAGCTLEYVTDAGPDPRSYRVDFGKLARTFPAFRLRWNASFGAKDLYAALQEADVTLEEFQGRRYIRLAQITHLLGSDRLRHTAWVHRSNRDQGPLSFCRTPLHRTLSISYVSARREIPHVEQLTRWSLYRARYVCEQVLVQWRSMADPSGSPRVRHSPL